MISNLSMILTLNQYGNLCKSSDDGNWNYIDNVAYLLQLINHNICITTNSAYKSIINQLTQNKKSKKSKNKAIKKSTFNNIQFIIIGNCEYDQSNITNVKNFRDAIQQNSDNKPMWVFGDEKLLVEALSWVNELHIMISNKPYSYQTAFPLQYITTHFQPVEGSTSLTTKIIKYSRRK